MSSTIYPANSQSSYSPSSTSSYTYVVDGQHGGHFSLPIPRNRADLPRWAIK